MWSGVARICDQPRSTRRDGGELEGEGTPPARTSWNHGAPRRPPSARHRRGSQTRRDGAAGSSQRSNGVPGALSPATRPSPEHSTTPSSRSLSIPNSGPCYTPPGPDCQHGRRTAALRSTNPGQRPPGHGRLQRRRRHDQARRQHRADDRGSQPGQTALAGRRRPPTRPHRPEAALVRPRCSSLPRRRPCSHGAALRPARAARHPRRLHHRPRTDDLEAILRTARTHHAPTHPGVARPDMMPEPSNPSRLTRAEARCSTITRVAGDC